MNWFINWIRRDTEIRNGKLAHMLAGWEDTFDGLYKRRIAAIKTAASVVQTRLKTVSSKVSAVTKNVCQKNACKGKTATGNLNRGWSFASRVTPISSHTNNEQFPPLSKRQRTSTTLLLHPTPQRKKGNTYFTTISATSKLLTILIQSFWLLTTSTTYSTMASSTLYVESCMGSALSLPS